MPEGLSEPPIWTPLIHSHGQWTGKIEGEISNLARGNTVTMRVPACVTLLIKIQSQINVRQGQFWLTYRHACGSVSMSTEAKSHPACVRTSNQMMEAVRSELSCDSGTVSAVACVIYELIRQHQPLSCWEGGGLSSFIYSQLPPPSIIWFCYFRFIIISSVSLICLHRLA